MKVISITGKRWFQKTYGNTYFSASASIDGEQVASIDFQYGYGNQWEWEIAAKLDKAGLLPGIKHNGNGSTESLFSYCKRNGIILVSSVSDVQRRKDL